MFATAAALPSIAKPEVLNKVVASVGYDAITQHDVMEEYRFELFLQGKSPTGVPTKAEQKSVLSRLISQKLLAQQLRGPVKESKDGKKMAEETLASVRKKFPGNQAYESAIKMLGMNEQQVLDRLELYQRTLRLIDNRLRPAAQPEPSEVEDYYKKTFVPEYRKEHAGSPPPLDDVREQIREVLVQKKMNQLLGNWLQRLKSDHRVTIYSY